MNENMMFFEEPIPCYLSTINFNSCDSFNEEYIKEHLKSMIDSFKESIEQEKKEVLSYFEFN